MRILLTLFSILWIFPLLNGQYIVTTNPKCVAALEEKSLKGDPLLNTAINFIQTANSGSFKQWQTYLSKENDPDTADLKTREWWNYLSSHKSQYNLIAEQRENTKDNKIVYFKSLTENDKIIKVRMVKENNQWKVLSVDL